MLGETPSFFTMNQNIEVSIADILARLESKIDRLEGKIDNLSNEVNQVKVDVAKVDEKISGLDKRLSNLEFIARTVGGGIIIALLLALTRFLFPSVTL